MEMNKIPIVTSKFYKINKNISIFLSEVLMVFILILYFIFSTGTKCKPQNLILDLG